MKSTETVFLPGASGTMGYEAFKELWSRRLNEDGSIKYRIVLLQRPSKKNKKLFKPYEKEAGLNPISGKGVVENEQLRIIWGNATDKDCIWEACDGVDWVLNAMALIPPISDFKPDLVRRVNHEATKEIIKAIESQPNGADRIKYIYVGSISQTGDRLPPIHHARVGDPIKACIFDTYTITKNESERFVMESDLKYWASLRVTFIMAQDVMDMQGSYMFYQPLGAYMENISARDAGLGLVNCLDIPEDSDFWKRAYSMTGGPKCRTVFLDVLKKCFGMLGMDYKNIMKRKWFALQNYHMHFFDDSHILNEYLDFWNDTLEDYYRNFWENLPFALKAVAYLCKRIKPFRRLVEKATYKRMKKMAEAKPQGTMFWYKSGNDLRIKAFFGSYKAIEQIPGWGVDEPHYESPETEPEWNEIDHGYDDSKGLLDLDDLKDAAKFRGGECLSESWSGEMYEDVEWECAFGHKFILKPYTVLKAGYWCPKCAPPPWNYDKIAEKNPFFAQVWYPMHDKNEDNFYPEDVIYEFQKFKEKNEM